MEKRKRASLQWRIVTNTTLTNDQSPYQQLNFVDSMYL